MDIRNKTTQELGVEMAKHIEDFFGDSTVDLSEPLFQESYALEFWEIKHNIPEKYHISFGEEDIINNLSGEVTIISENKKYENYDYTAILLTDQDSTEAYFLLLQEMDKDTGEADIVVVKNFMEVDHAE